MAAFIARAHAGGDANVPPGPPAPSFLDVPLEHSQYKYVEYCKSRGIVFGYPDGLYHPGYTVDRGTMAIYIARAIGGHKIISRPASPTYTDLRTNNEEECQAIEYLSSSMNASGGVVVGGYGGGLYAPAVPVDRGQMAAFAARGFAVPQ
jgi:hypothetical protein